MEVVKIVENYIGLKLYWVSEKKSELYTPEQF